MSIVLLDLGPTLEARSARGGRAALGEAHDERQLSVASGSCQLEPRKNSSYRQLLDARRKPKPRCKPLRMTALRDHAVNCVNDCTPAL